MGRISYTVSDIPADAIVLGAGQEDVGSYSKTYTVPSSAQLTAEDMVWSATSTRSLYTLAPECVKRGMDGLLESRAELAEMPIEALEGELEGDLGKKGSEGGLTLESLKTLRMTLWEEYNRAVSNRTLMYLDRVVRGVLSPNGFYTHVCAIPLRLAYILCPPPDYHTVLGGLHAVALERLRAILELPLTQDVYNKEGEVVGSRVNTAAATVILRAYQMLDTRLKGSVVQRVQQQSISVQMRGKGAVVPSMSGGGELELLDVNSIDAKIRELEQTVGRVAPPVLGVLAQSNEATTDECLADLVEDEGVGTDG